MDTTNGHIKYLWIETNFVNIALLEIKILAKQTSEVLIVFWFCEDICSVLSSIFQQLWHPVIHTYP